MATPGPRITTTWSHNEPVTVFGAVRTVIGWAKVGPAFEWLAKRFSDCKSFEIEVIAAGASDDLGYLVPIEHTTCSVLGAPQYRTHSASPRSSDARLVSGRSSTATPMR
jgi:hypothetical protein